MNKILERVARAIDPMCWDVPEDDYPAERSRRYARQFSAISAAGRAIEAMRPSGDEPDYISDVFWGDLSADNVVNMYINEALK